MVTGTARNVPVRVNVFTYGLERDKPEVGPVLPEGVINVLALRSNIRSVLFRRFDDSTFDSCRDTS